ncbi:MAG: hypothetical protein K2Y37_20850 [Pirellulales bacterium]|nr:hypothetical protein [Pirellulales bacterium]
MHLFHEPQPELDPARQALRGLLSDLASGTVELRCLNSRASVHVEYKTSNGWKLSVFNDAGYWDYLESAEDPSGQLLDFDEVQAVKGVDWSAIKALPIWGQFLNHFDIDPDFPSGDAGS